MSGSSLIENLQNHFKVIIVFFLLALTLLVYARAIENDFVNLDDPSYVTENPHVVTGLGPANLGWAFTSIEKANWHPLTWLSHMADAQIFGIDPRGHHLTSVLLHGVNCVLLFLLLLRVTGARWRSALVAALFAVHPLHVESVAWVAERKDVLSTLFLLLTILAYAAYVRRPGPWRYTLTLILFALGLMAKPMLVTLPCLLLLLDYWPLGRFHPHPAFGHPLPEREGIQCPSPSGRRDGMRGIFSLVIEKIPFFILSICSAVVTIYAQKHGGAVASLELLPLGERIGNSLLAYVSYLGKTIYPTGLVALYPLPEYTPLWRVAAAAVFLASVTVFSLLKGRRFHYLCVGWLWFLGTLVPVIGLVQVGGQAMADRYTYIPHIGLFVAMVWGAGEIAGRWKLPPAPVVGVAAGIIAILSAVTWAQIGHWRNGIYLFGHTLMFTERNALAHYHMGVALNERGRLDEAILHYLQALNIEPNLPLARFGLGCSYIQRGEVDRAVPEYEKALRLDPGSAKVLYNLGLALFSQGKLDEAIVRYGEALHITPGDDNIHNNLGIALARRGRVDDAMVHFAEALRINPDNEYARINIRTFGGLKANE